MAISDKLKSLRTERGLSQKQMGEKINISDKVISKWERGVSTPKIENLIKIADFFDISIDELLPTNASTQKIFDKQKIERSLPFYIFTSLSIAIFLISLIWFLYVFTTNNGVAEMKNLQTGQLIKTNLSVGFAYIAFEVLFLIVLAFLCNYKTNIDNTFYKNSNKYSINQIVKSPTIMKRLYKIAGINYAIVILIIELNYFTSIVFLNLLIIKPFSILISSVIIMAVGILATFFTSYRLMNKLVKLDISNQTHS